jgi:hypothetical protein
MEKHVESAKGIFFHADNLPENIKLHSMRPKDNRLKETLSGPPGVISLSQFHEKQ